MEKDKRLEIATFRFGVISEFVTGVHLNYGEKEELLKNKASRTYTIPHSSSSRVSRSTIKKWISDYKQAGYRLEGLMPSVRKDQGSYKSLNDSLQLAIKEIISDSKEYLTGMALINELRHRKHIGPSDSLNLSVLYKFLKSSNLQTKVPKDRRSFEANGPNELWQSDVLHGPLVIGPKGKRIKSYLIAVLDDHSRLIPHGEFYFSEKLDDFKNCLKKAMEKRGLPQKLYIDNGSCYKAINLEQITALLGVQIIHTPAYTPQGRGKIERWFRYVRENFLPSCPSKLTLDELNEKFDDWVDMYHNKVHSVTQQAPIERYRANMKCVRPVPHDLWDYFRFVEFRQVKKDRTLRLNGVFFEAPVDLIDKRVELRFHKECPEEVEIFFDGRSFGMATILDKQVNFKVGRNQKVISELQKTPIENGKLF